jgi:TetR/AcrR family transcriptional regulator, regulator of mycofactocin system
MAVTSAAENSTYGPDKPSLPAKLREQRLETVIAEVERIALRLFDQRGFAEVTVEDITSEAGISVRTFYRYFPTKEDLLQVRLRREARALKSALDERPPDESPVRSVRVAFAQVVALEDPAHVGRWIRVIAGTPNVLAGVFGAVQLISNAVIRDFFASRLGEPEDSMAPWIWAAAAGGAIQAAYIRWHLDGGELNQIMSEGLEILEGGIATGAPPPVGEASGPKPKRTRRSPVQPISGRTPPQP